MTEGTPKAIEPKGITRNATKIGVQDGQAEDLINLRFMDGSWRASGNGRQIENMPTGTIYEQLYVHTNVYHHLLGVDNGVLYWFAEIDNDGVTFYPLDGTSDRSLWPEDKQDLPTERVTLTNVVGDIWITQTGHLLTVIDEADDFEHLVFKTGENQYAEVNVDVNGNPADRLLYPFGQVHFNYVTEYSSLLFQPHVTRSSDTPRFTEQELLTVNHRHLSIGKLDTRIDNLETIKNKFITLQGQLRNINVFSGAIIALAAIKLYDDSFVYASNPVLIYPRQQINNKNLYLLKNENTYIVTSTEYNKHVWLEYKPRSEEDTSSSVETTYPHFENYRANGNYLTPIYTIVDCRDDILPPAFFLQETLYSGALTSQYLAVLGYDIAFSIKDLEIIKQNKDVLKSLCIFITSEEDVTCINKSDVIDYRTLVYDRPTSEIIYKLMHSPLFLLKEYKAEDITILQNPVINLTSEEDKNLLKNITKQQQFPTESLSRTTYLPKVAYQYNGRLHIANYKTYPFFGYPIDLFHLHNHSVKVQENAWFKGVLPNLADNNDAYLQYVKAQKAIANYEDLVTAGAPYFLVKVYIDSSQGEQVVCRYIPAYNPYEAPEHTANFIEDLNPLLTYPDARAKKMEIFYVDNYTSEDYIDQENVKHKACAWVRMKEFKLTPHPYLNIAYYMDPDLHPIKLADFEQVLTTYEEDIYEVIVSKTIPELKALIKMENAEEYFPNGLKVSKTDQPMFFPVDYTYQVGSAEILALMSNTIAVGTGQTGDAPLYVFCKDGVYALYVDSSGQMAYPNARILARDVCNNPRSVTPIDAGVVFTTDRGLMMIAGEQVQEIGAPAEGDVVQFWNAGSVDYSKIATASMQQIAGLPSELCSTTDFLTYLQDKGTSGKAAIINYNHNMRELMVSNPNYPYSYVLDREGNWSRRDYTAAQYVNNYPTSYRVDEDGHFYKVDDEGDAGTSLEHRKEADNKIFYLSNVIKLDSIGFKQAYRFVVRGYFETMMAPVERVERAILQKSIDSRNFYIEEDSHVLSQTNLPVMNHLVGMSDVTNGLRVGDVLVLDPIGNPLAEDQEIVITEVTRDDVYLAQDVVITEGVTGFTLSRKRTVIDHVPTNVACVVEGSYDGRKFKPLGYNRKSGKFRDIGCLVSHTDVRFFRICLSGQVTGKTRIDYMEMSAGASMLNTKIR